MKKQYAHIIFLLFIIYSCMANVQASTAVGKIVFTKGAVSLIEENKPTRILRRGNPLNVGERVRTGKDAKAILKLNDGTQISLKEQTEFEVKSFSLQKNKETAELHLFTGGIRAITGLVNKQRKNNFKLTTSIASIGIRGTDFTAVLCQTNCDDAAKQTQEDQGAQVSKAVQVKVDTQVKARLIVKKGDVQARNRRGKLRHLSKESPLYKGDTLITGKKSIAVIVFKDNTRTTVQSISEFLIADYSFQPKNASQSKADFKLLKGSMRFLSGGIAKLNRYKYKISTPVSSIGIRGTGFDLAYSNPTYLMVWQGLVNFVFPNGEILVKTGEIYYLANEHAQPKLIKKMPNKFQQAPRPDSPEIKAMAKIAYLFGSRDNEGKAGLYLFVKEGEIEAENDHVRLNLGAGESGFMDEDSAYRISYVPDFLLTPFLDPDASQTQLDMYRLSPALFDGIDFVDTGTVCEIR